MFFSQSCTIRERLIVLLATRGTSTAKSLHAAFRGKVSLQAVYQELRKLIKTQTAIKLGTKYSLKLAWASDFVELAEKIKKIPIRVPELESLRIKKKQHWLLNDWASTLNLWSQLTFSLIELTNSPTLLEWAPHAIYHLVSTDAEEQFLRTLQRYSVGFYLIVGADTPLDREYQNYFKKAGREISFASSPFQNLEDRFFSVIGNYLVIVKPAKPYMLRLDKVFTTTASLSVNQAIDLTRLLNSRTRIKIEVLNDPNRTRAIRRKFKEFFGTTDELPYTPFTNDNPSGSSTQKPNTKNTK